MAPAFHFESSRLLVPCTFPESGTRLLLPLSPPWPATACQVLLPFLPLSVRPAVPSVSLSPSSFSFRQRRRCVLLVLHDYSLCTFLPCLLACRLSFRFSLPSTCRPWSLFIASHPSSTTKIIRYSLSKGPLSLPFSPFLSAR